MNKDLLPKVLFKSVVFRLINRIDTFLDFGGIPDLNNLSKFLTFLKNRKSQKIKTFTSAHQTNGFRSIEAFKFVKKNIAKLTSDIVSEAKRGSIKLCFETICKIPYVNKFFANQILCDLLETKVLGPKATENIWIC